VQLDSALVHQLRLLDAANMIEQGEERTTLTRLPTIRSVWKEHIAATLSLSAPTALSFDRPLFAHFFHFSYGGHLLPVVKLSSVTVSDFEGFHQQILSLIPSTEEHTVKRRVSGVKVRAVGGLIGEVELDDGSDTIPFSADQLRLLASNLPAEPYELILDSNSADTAASS